VVFLYSMVDNNRCLREVDEDISLTMKFQSRI